MAIPGVPFKLDAKDVGAADLAGSIAQGLQLGFMPRELQANLGLKKAEANSKNAYSSLMLPQALFKLMGNKEIWESLPEDIRTNLTGFANKFTENGITPQNTIASPEGEKIQTGNGNESAPIKRPLNQAIYDHEMNNQQLSSINESPTAAGRQGSYQGTVAEGKKLGEDRATAIDNAEKIYSSGIEKKAALESLKDDLEDPEFKNLRTIPYAKQHEIDWYKENGTEKQQKLIGSLESKTNQIITSSIKDFGSRMSDKDLALLKNMKINPNDKASVAFGKYEALASFTEYLNQKNKTFSNLMRKNKDMSVIDGLDMTNNLVKEKEIRNKIHNDLYRQTEKVGVNDQSGGVHVIEHDGKKYMHINGRWMPA
jgi:hypothetical protein